MEAYWPGREMRSTCFVFRVFPENSTFQTKVINFNAKTGVISNGSFPLSEARSEKRELTDDVIRCIFLFGVLRKFKTLVFYSPAPGSPRGVDAPEEGRVYG